MDLTRNHTRYWRRARKVSLERADQIWLVALPLITLSTQDMIEVLIDRTGADAPGTNPGTDIAPDPNTGGTNPILVDPAIVAECVINTVECSH